MDMARDMPKTKPKFCWPNIVQNFVNCKNANLHVIWHAWCMQHLKTTADSTHWQAS